MQVVFGRRRRCTEVNDARQGAIGGEGGRAITNTSDATGAAEERAVNAGQLAVGDGHAEGSDTTAVVVGERDFGDDDLDADLREDNVDLVD